MFKPIRRVVFSSSPIASAPAPRSASTSATAPKSTVPPPRPRNGLRHRWQRFGSHGFWPLYQRSGRLAGGSTIPPPALNGQNCRRRSTSPMATTIVGVSALGQPRCPRAPRFAVTSRSRASITGSRTFSSYQASSPRSAATLPRPAALSINIIVGLFATCLVASSNYVINEVLDAPSDRFHPVKHKRPVPSGQVNVPLAYVQWIALMLIGVGLGLTVSIPFAATLFVLWVMGCIYNIPPVRSKDVPYIDVLSESINNPLRMLAGWFIASTARSRQRRCC